MTNFLLVKIPPKLTLLLQLTLSVYVRTNYYKILEAILQGRKYSGKEDFNLSGPVCFSLNFKVLISKLHTMIDSPPQPSPRVKSPPWIIKLGIILWNVLP